MKTVKLTKGTVVYKIVFFIVFLIFLAYAISFIFPIFWLVVSSLSSKKEYQAALSFFPSVIQWGNYAKALSAISFHGHSFFEMSFNSLWYSLGGAFLGIATSTCFSYVISKYRFFGRKILYALAIFVMLVPIVGSFASQYRLYKVLGLLNSPTILIAFTSGFGMNFLVMTASFDNLSWNYAEAAFIDGAGHFSVFLMIMLPQIFAPFSALFIVSFIENWNDYMSPFLFMRELPTLSTGLYLYEQEIANDFSLSMPIYFAGVVLCVIPALVLFLVFQNTIMDMTVSGGVKE